MQEGLPTLERATDRAVSEWQAHGRNVLSRTRPNAVRSSRSEHGAAGACGRQLLLNGWAATSLFVAILGGEGFGASQKSGADVVFARKQVSRDAVHLRIHSVRLCALSAVPWLPWPVQLGE